MIIKRQSNNIGHLWEEPQKIYDIRGLKYAFATFLTNDNDADYVLNARLMGWQLLVDPTTANKIGAPFIIMCTPQVSQETRELLTSEGATVQMVEEVVLPRWIQERIYVRWKEQFTKLRFLQMTQYDRILYLDSDHLLIQPLDNVFQDRAALELSETNRDGVHRYGGNDTLLPDTYLLAARPDNGDIARKPDAVDAGDQEHPFPPIEHGYMNAGFLLAAPSEQLFRYYESFLSERSAQEGLKSFELEYAEQEMLNFVHRREGPMPWKSLDYHWDATHPSDRDVLGGVVSYHEKFWGESGPKRLRRVWKAKVKEMKKYYLAKSKKQFRGDAKTKRNHQPHTTRI